MSGYIQGSTSNRLYRKLETFQGSTSPGHGWLRFSEKDRAKYSIELFIPYTFYSNYC